MKELVRILLVVMSALGASLLAHGDEQMVFIHGYDSGPEVWDTMVGLMDEWGYSRENVTVCDYQSQSKNTSIEDLASSVYWESIDPLLRVGKTELLFVVHSMGGLLLRSMVDQGLLSEDYVESVVSLAVPHYGAALPGVDMQTRQMKRGSSFIWNLANTKRKIQPSKVLSVSCGTRDEVVDYWSAKYIGSAVRYVNKRHYNGIPESSTSAGRKYGLVVGVGEYEYPWLSPLTCTATDVDSMCRMLTDYGAWNSDDLTVLQDSRATLGAIRSGLRHLAEVAVPGDEVVVYQSSHGGNDLGSTVDCCVYAYDGPYYDYQMAEDLALFRKGVKVVVVLDACHSGGMFKDASASYAGLPDFMPRFASRVSSYLDGGLEIKSSTERISASEIGWLTAVDYDQLSVGGYWGSEFTTECLFRSGVQSGEADWNGDGAISFGELYRYSHYWFGGSSSVPQALNEDVLDSVALATDARDRGICACGGGDGDYYDTVFRLVLDFFFDDWVGYGDESAEPREDEEGGELLIQIVRNGVPVAFGDKDVPVSRVLVDGVPLQSATGYGFANVSDGEARGKGIVSVIGTPVEGRARPLPPGRYTLSLGASSSSAFEGYTPSRDYVVKSGETTIARIETNGRRKPIDFVFLIDTTGSMYDDIYDVQTECDNLLRSLINDDYDARVALVDFKDFPVSPYGDYDDYTYRDRVPFCDDIDTLSSAIWELGADGGNDTPESIYSALAHVIDGRSLGGWRKGAAKAIMLMTDSYAHDPEPFTGYTADDIVRMARGLMVVKPELDGAEYKDAGESGEVISIYPVATSSSYLSDLAPLAEGTDGLCLAAADYDSVSSCIMAAIDDVALGHVVVSFDIGTHGEYVGGGALSQTLRAGETPVAPKVQAKTGYRFVGWSADFSTISSDLVVSARYEAIKYAITYGDTRSAANPNPSTYTIEDSVTFAKLPDVYGFDFDSWSSAGIPRGSVGNVSVQARWTWAPVLHRNAQTGTPGPSESSVYNGCIVGADDSLRGTFTVQTQKAKQNRQTAETAVPVSVVLIGRDGKKVNFKGTVPAGFSGTVTLVARTGQTIDLAFSANSVSGSYEGSSVSGTRGAYKDKDGAQKTLADSVLNVWKQGYVVVLPAEDGLYDMFSISVGKNGAASISGVLASEQKISGKSTLLVGDDYSCVPVSIVKRGVDISFNVWVANDRSRMAVSGRDDAVVSEMSGVDGEFHVRGSLEDCAAFDGLEVLEAYLPDGAAVETAQRSVVVANGERGGRVTVKKGELDDSKAGLNPSNLKLKLNAKTGLVTGTFVVYALKEGSTVTCKTVKAKVTGMAVKGGMLGIASFGKKGRVPVAVQ